MKKAIYLSSVACALMAVFLLSCQETNLHEPQSIDSEIQDIALKSTEIFNANPDYLEETILKLSSQYDGDTEVLLHYLNDDFKLQLGWTQDKYETYEFRMPLSDHFSMNDILENGLLIAYLDESVDDAIAERVPAYTLNGEHVWLYKEKATEMPYLVFAKSDRVENGIFTFGDFTGTRVQDISFDNSAIVADQNLANARLSGWEHQLISEISTEMSYLRGPVPIDDDIGPDPIDDDPGNGDPPPPRYYTAYPRVVNYTDAIKVHQRSGQSTSLPGIKIEKVRIKKNLDSDWWLDGKLEMEFRFYQTVFSTYLDIDGPVDFNGLAGFEYRDFYVYRKDHKKKKDRTYTVNAVKPMNNLQAFQVPNTNYYIFNEKIRLRIKDIDKGADEIYVTTDFIVDLYFDVYNGSWYWPHNKIGILLRKGNYSSFN